MSQWIEILQNHSDSGIQTLKMFFVSCSCQLHSNSHEGTWRSTWKDPKPSLIGQKSKNSLTGLLDWESLNINENFVLETECSMFELRVSGSQTEKGTSNHEIHKARSFLCNSISHWWDKRSKWTGTYSFSKYSLCVIHSAKKTTVIFVYWRCALCFFWRKICVFMCQETLYH